MEEILFFHFLNDSKVVHWLLLILQVHSLKLWQLSFGLLTVLIKVMEDLHNIIPIYTGLKVFLYFSSLRSANAFLDLQLDTIFSFREAKLMPKLVLPVLLFGLAHKFADQVISLINYMNYEV